jgi:hypothetical protein
MDPRNTDLAELSLGADDGADDGIRSRAPHLGKAACNNFTTSDFVDIWFYGTLCLP